MISRGELIVRLLNGEIELPEKWRLTRADTIKALLYTQDKRIHKLLVEKGE